MRLLLDTHVLLWAVFEPEKLNKTLRETLEDRENIITVSAASLWEIAIKQNIGKLSIPHSFLNEIQENSGFEILPIKTQHIESYLGLPLLHRDPFDRMLIAQAQYEQLTLVTCDELITQYNEISILRC